MAASGLGTRNSWNPGWNKINKNDICLSPRGRSLDILAPFLAKQTSQFVEHWIFPLAVKVVYNSNDLTPFRINTKNEGPNWFSHLCLKCSKQHPSKLTQNTIYVPNFLLKFLRSHLHLLQFKGTCSWERSTTTGNNTHKNSNFSFPVRLSSVWCLPLAHHYHTLF